MGWLVATCLLLCNLGCDGSAKLEVTPTELNYGTIAGDAHIRLTVKNAGDSGFFESDVDLEFTITASEDWLRLDPYETLVLPPGDSQSFEVWVDRGELLQGRNNGWVDITSNGGDASVMVLVWRDDTPLRNDPVRE